ncbi:MAG: GNAT family N-acetyltransferase [Clostridia bacterium]|nr:GNAT family N-acetyltransferase [Clostridia bacterium]
MIIKNGIASKLYSIIKKIAQNSSSRKITVNSSCYGLGFYHKLGFTDLEPEKIVDGIRFTPMEINI